MLVHNHNGYSLKKMVYKIKIIPFEPRTKHDQMKNKKKGRQEKVSACSYSRETKSLHIYAFIFLVQSPAVVLVFCNILLR